MAFIVEFDPALEHVHELKRRAMQVGLARKRCTGCRANYVRHDLPLGRHFDAKIAVLEKRAQAALEMRVARVADGESFGRHGFASPVSSQGSGA